MRRIDEFMWHHVCQLRDFRCLTMNSRQIERIAGYAVVLAVVLTIYASAEIKDGVVTRIVNGVNSHDDPAVAQLLFNPDGAPDQEGTVSYCTATLIGCQTLLTAAHCAEQRFSGQILAFFQHAGFYEVDAIAIHPIYPGLPPSSLIADVAVLKLASPVEGIKPIPLNINEPTSFPRDGVIIGFGLTGHDAQDTGIKRRGRVQTSSCTPFQIPFFDDETSVCWLSQVGTGEPGTSSSTCIGDSGGPLLIDFGQGMVVAGVHSKDFPLNEPNLPCQRGSLIGAANVYTYQNFILSELGLDNTEECGNLPSARSVIARSGRLSDSNDSASLNIEIGNNIDELRIAINGEGRSGFDIDLEVDGPERERCLETHISPFEFCKFRNPEPGNWSIEIDQLNGSGEYQLTATLFGERQPSQEIQVNTFTEGAQEEPAIAMNSQGAFVIVWQDDAEPLDFTEISSRRFLVDGTPQGAEFQINNDIERAQRVPDIAMDETGNFVVVWESNNNDDVRVRRFHADGTPVGNEFPVDDLTTTEQNQAAIAMNAQGNFIIVWDSPPDNQRSSKDVFARRFAADATPQGNAFQVNTTIESSQALPDVAIDDKGDFVVVWEGQDNDDRGIFGRRFLADGTPQGDEFQINTFTEGHQETAAIAMDNQGNFVVVWESDGQEEDVASVFARRFLADGTPQGDEFQINTFAEGYQGTSAIAMDAQGNFVVVWDSEWQDQTGSEVFARQFLADGTPQGDEFQVNTTTDDDQGYSDIGMDAQGNFVIVWQSEE